MSFVAEYAAFGGVMLFAAISPGPDMAVIISRAMTGRAAGAAAAAGVALETGSSTIGNFWRGFLSNILNPKAAVFFVALVPQFVRHADGVRIIDTVALPLIAATVIGAWYLVSGRRCRLLPETPVRLVDTQACRCSGRRDAGRRRNRGLFPMTPHIRMSRRCLG